MGPALALQLTSSVSSLTLANPPSLRFSICGAGLISPVSQDQWVCGAHVANPAQSPTSIDICLNSNYYHDYFDPDDTIYHTGIYLFILIVEEVREYAVF